MVPSFHTTRWTQVVRAKSPSQEGREALKDLCEAYYAPVQIFLRRQDRDADAARELAHAFFEQMLGGATIHSADQLQGRFRSYLLGAVKHFLSHRHEAAQRMRRGSGVLPVSLQAESETSPAMMLADEDRLSPDEAYDRQWALTVLERALAALREECADEGKSELFEKLHPWLTGEAEHGDQAALAESLRMNMNSLKSTVHRLKQRFRTLVREEIACTLDDEAAVEEEMRVLFTALKNR